jgi:hypothetical protein
MLLDMIDWLIDNATAMTEMNSFKKDVGDSCGDGCERAGGYRRAGE